MIAFVAIDLFCCVSGKVPKNEPYYLLKSEEEKETERRIAEEAARIKSDSLKAVILETTQDYVAGEYGRAVKHVKHVSALKSGYQEVLASGVEQEMIHKKRIVDDDHYQKVKDD